MAEKALLLEDLTHDIVLRAKICTILADRMFQNIRAMERVSGGDLDAQLGFDELHYQVFEMLKTAQELAALSDG